VKYSCRSDDKRCRSGSQKNLARDSLFTHRFFSKCNVEKTPRSKSMDIDWSDAKSVCAIECCLSAEKHSAVGQPHYPYRIQ
jgi:hypothetical protein